MPPAELAAGHYLIRVTGSDNSTPKISPSISPIRRPRRFRSWSTAASLLALCHSGDPSTWNASDPGFDQQKMQTHVTADLSGLTGNPNDTAVPAEVMLGRGLVGWNTANARLTRRPRRSGLYPSDSGEFSDIESQRHPTQ